MKLKDKPQAQNSKISSKAIENRDIEPSLPPMDLNGAQNTWKNSGKQETSKQQQWHDYLNKITKFGEFTLNGDTTVSETFQLDTANHMDEVFSK